MNTQIRKTVCSLALFTVTLLFSQKVKPPVMGWSSWNNYRININEKLIKEQADAMVSSGLYEAGYRYINIDDGYFGGRDEKGNLIIDNKKFPSGMKSLAAYIHSKGLKAGIYSDAGKNTCGSIWDNDKQGFGVGLYGHLDRDADLFFKEWKYDFIKVDWCGGEQMKLNEQEEYTKIINKVKSIDPDIVFNVCRWQFPGEWAIKIADSWRVSGDISAKFSSILHIIDLNKNLYPYASAGHYNDMDMLQVGRGMSYDEDKTHFSMWALLNSPLLAGNDLRSMSKATIEILTNKEIIALNQDTAFKQAQNIITDGNIEVWQKMLAKGQRAIAIMNRGDQEINYTLSASKLGLNQNTKIRDLWLHKNLGKYVEQQTFKIPQHGIIVLKTY
ncbi:glycoside hydrolase family 27 protein [Elizabethkingia occulta]|uniref:Alpha-galactosidase n=1 Tax=Elizabethkingia occulta TaxID=1867263 RepID=A0A1T3MZ14_9FLAO|nr:glycoside hydrolase family 27 protein [Elizabethkingia occulta]OPB87207.1 alpha-galactosidase [Elizabethkingia occulta]OPC69842.1 alpha-galactosidase [Elizabethkingia occulta]